MTILVPTHIAKGEQLYALVPDSGPDFGSLYRWNCLYCGGGDYVEAAGRDGLGITEPPRDGMSTFVHWPGTGSAVPEPGTAALLIAGLAVVVILRRAM